MIPRVVIGDGPLLLAQPHGGTEIPTPIRDRLNPRGQTLIDTDWHIDRLYAGLAARATVVATPIHRYVIDANRDPADLSLYPGQNTTGLCPTTTFDGEPIYRDGQQPSADEIGERLQRYHRPYHDALREQLERLRQKHGYVILYDCHSIRAVVPYLFDGRLPDLNLGTNDGRSCDPRLERAAQAACAAADGFSWVLNGRFKGGWTTRHYGEPGAGCHALQMELAQCNYMLEEPPWTYDEDKAARLRAILGPLLDDLAGILA